MTEPKAVVEELFRRLLARDDRVLDNLVAVDMVNTPLGRRVEKDYGRSSTPSAMISATASSSTTI